MKKGMTLIELVVALLLFSVLMGAAVILFNEVLLSWASSGTRSGIEIQLERAVEEMVRDLREAKQIQDGPSSSTHYDEIRYTPDNSTYYVYYLYHASDSYVPPPAFGQSSYQLFRETLSGGIGGTFAYGSGTLLLTDVLPPTATDLSVNSSLATLDISVTRGDETIRSRTQVRPRNL